MYARPNLDAQALDGIPNRPGALHRRCGRLEAGEKAIAGRVDFDASAPCDFRPDEGMMLFEQSAPAGVTQSLGVLRGPDDVREEQRGQDPCRFEFLALLPL